MPRAELSVMCAKRLEDLIIWQLANELKDELFQLLTETSVSMDWKFRIEITDAMSSVTRNMSEGFGRFHHKEFAQFLKYSRGFLYEVSDDLRDGVKRRYWTTARIEKGIILSKRTTKAVTKFMLYLRNTPDWNGSDPP